MPHNFHLVFEQGEKYVIGYCLEVPGANGQGTSIEECRENLIDAIDLVLLDRLEDGMRGIPQDAKIELLALG